MDSENKRLRAELAETKEKLAQAQAEIAALKRPTSAQAGREASPNWSAWKAMPKLALWEAIVESRAKLSQASRPKLSH